MTRVIVDPTTGAKLCNVRKVLELCDESGRLLGHFTPTLEKSVHKAMEPKISEDEIQRREQQGGGRPLAAILADLGKRA